MSDMKIMGSQQSTLAAMQSSGDIGAEVAALMLQSAAAEKQGARQTRDMEEQALEAAEQREVDEIRTQANAALGQAVLSGLGSIAKGTGSTVGGALEAKAARQEADKSAMTRAKAKIWEGAGVAGEGLHTAGAGAFDHAEKMAKAAEKQASIAADRAKNGLADAKDAIDDAKRRGDKAIDFYKEWTQGAAGAMQASLHRS